MNDKRTIRLSKRLSWLLRHGAHEAGVAMDQAGWVPVEQVLRWLGTDRSTLDHVVAHNNKRRLQIEAERIRCCQGHSTSGTPVTCGALEASWQRWRGTAVVWHGTALSALPAIDASGLKPLRRTHVHLAEGLHSTVGKRASVHVMLAVDPQRAASAGYPLWVAQNGVILARRVPRACIVGVQPMTRRARDNAAALVARFGAI